MFSYFRVFRIVSAHPFFVLCSLSVRSSSKTTVATGGDNDDANADSAAADAADRGNAAGLTLSDDADCWNCRCCYCWCRWTVIHWGVAAGDAAIDGGDAAGGGNGATHCHRRPYQVAVAVGDC